MIALKTNQMSADILCLDSALRSPADHFFTEDGLQTQHSSEITSQLASDQWLQDFEDIRRFCDGLELSLNYEPELSLEAMTDEVDTQYQTKADDIIDYLDSTIFLSPESIEPSSPLQPEAQPDGTLDSEAAISLLEEILVSNADDNSLQEQIFDEFTVELIPEDSIEVSIPTETEVLPKIEERPKRQLKRKAREPEVTAKPKPKKSRSTVEAKRERKRSQNKSAANRYRQKKRAELDGMESEFKDCQDMNAQLKAQLQKLQMEFKVVYPLAKAAFAADPKRSLQLQMLDIRVLNGELLE